MNKKISFKELASISGVSIGTLSRYFNNGFVSEKNKEIIKNNIEHYGYVKNSAAARIRGGNNELMILRTVIRSRTLDNIVSGIIENIDADVTVKYSGINEKEVISSINEAISKAPKYLVIFAPINATKKMETILVKASKYSKVVVYNYKSKDVSSINVSYIKAFKELKKRYKKINFVYNDDEDVDTYKNRIKYLESVGIDIKASKNIDLNFTNFYQSEFLYTKIAYTKINNGIVVSYEQPIKYSKKIDWIFVDQYFIGVNISKLCKKNEILDILIDAVYIDND